MRKGTALLALAAQACAGVFAHAGPKSTPTPPPLAFPDTERTSLDRAARAPQGEARIAPSPSGRLGAWLVVGPFRSSTWDKKQKPPGPDALDQSPAGVDERELAPRLGASLTRRPERWVLASNGDGPVDVKAALHATESDIIAYAAG